jgi:hypothetical protein
MEASALRSVIGRKTLTCSEALAAERNEGDLQGGPALSAGEFCCKSFLFQKGKDALPVVALDQNFTVLDRSARPATALQFNRKHLETFARALKSGCYCHGFSAPTLRLASDPDHSIRRHGACLLFTADTGVQRLGARWAMASPFRRIYQSGKRFHGHGGAGEAGFNALRTSCTISSTSSLILLRLTMLVIVRTHCWQEVITA